MKVVWSTDDMVAAARAAERKETIERCAQVAENIEGWDGSRRIAAAIRALATEEK